MLPFVLGGASLGNLYRATTDEAAMEALSAAWDEGIREFDTAPHYGLGLSESRLGGFFEDKPRESFRITTKVGRLLVPRENTARECDAQGFAVPADFERRFDPSYGGIVHSLEESLRRLKLDRVDTLLLHDPDVYDLADGLQRGLPALERLREEGVVTNIGVGTNSVSAAEQAIRQGDLDVVMIAGRYTLLNQEAADSLLSVALAHDVRVYAAAVFNSGILATPASADARFDYGTAPTPVRARVDELRQLCARHGVPLAAAALQFPLRHDAVEVIVAGSASASEIRSNARALSINIPQEFWDEFQDRELADF